MSGSLTRDPSQTPFASDSVFNLPLGLGAQWQYNGQLASANAFVNTIETGYTENIYTSSASDPLVTITNSAAAGGTPGTFQVHIPVGAVAAAGNDATFSVDDTSTGTWYGFGGFNWTGSNTATVSQGSGESDTGSGIQVSGSNWDEGVGTIRQSDLQAGTINHMLRVAVPTDMLQSYYPTAYQLAPNAWPQTQEDGNGPSAYSGTIPYGVTVGIPANAVEPAAVAADAGANMLWHALQDHGAMIRDSGGSGNTVVFASDQNVAGQDPLILGMDQFGSQIMSETQILANQGPNSVNGGGTPIVPLDPPAVDGGGSTSTPPPPPPTSATGSGGSGGSGSTTTTTPSSSAGIVTPSSGGSVTDGSGNVWTLSSGGVTVENGNPIVTGSDTGALTAVNGVIWGQSATNASWYTYANGNWQEQSSAPPSSGATTSVTSGTTTTGSGSGSTTTTAPASTAGILTPSSGGSVTDASGAVWTLSSAGETVVNGNPLVSGSQTSGLTAVNGVIWGESSTNNTWYTYVNGSWQQQASAPPSASGSATAASGSQTSTTISASNTTINVQGSDQMVFITGSNDTVNLTGTTGTITDSGSGGNTFVLPTAGSGSATFDPSVLASGDTLNLANTLAATSWDGSEGTIGNYLSVSQGNGNTALQVSSDGSGGGTTVATFNNAQLDLSTILSHATT